MECHGRFYGQTLSPRPFPRHFPTPALSGLPSPHQSMAIMDLSNPANRPWSTIRPQLFHHHWCTMAAVRSIWLQKRSLPPHSAPDLDWQGISAAMHASPLRHCRWIVKFNSEQSCGVGSTLYRWKESDSAACPRCPHTPETTSHVLRCQGENSQVIWLRSIARLG